MLEAALSAAANFAEPMRLAFLFLGVIIGLFLGVIPGLGGLVGLTLLLPFTFTMDPYTAMAFLMGLQAVVVTSDTIPAVLFGVPGTIGSAATILDGYPMSKKGEAGRAFGAAFTASVIGGLFGALVLALSIPIIRPVLLEIGSPELFAICLLGLSLVVVLSGGSVMKGLAAACIGLLLATIGDDAQTATLRWTFGTFYLYDGLPIVTLALGLFAIPEIADLAISRKSIAGGANAGTRASQWEGVKDVFRNKFLVLRCSAIGSMLGAVPGIGSAVIDWIAYGHAARTEKGAANTFGTGDVRGVIASESSNNAKEGGALLPTLAFGVPGSASMALILGAFLIQGLVPGPEMLTKHLDVTYTLVWSVALANIIGAGLCFLFAKQLAKIALVPIGILAPMVIAISFIGAFQGHRSWGDLYALVLIGFIGWIMKRAGWPRPPLILGFVLGGILERYLFISINRYEWEWLWIYREGSFTPWVTILLAATIYGVLAPALRSFLRRERTAGRPALAISFQPDLSNVNFYFSVFACVCFVAAVILASDWVFGARILPQVVSVLGAFLSAALAISCLFRLRASDGAEPVVGNSGASQSPVEATRAAHMDATSDFEGLAPKTVAVRALGYFGWLVFLLAAAGTIGFLPSVFVFMVLYMWIQGRVKLETTLMIAVPTWAFSYALFHLTLNVPWPRSLLGEMLPFLASISWLDLF